MCDIVINSKITNNRQCSLCIENYGRDVCEKLQTITVAERWEVARQDRLCFQCFGTNHEGNDCKFTRIYEMNGCRKTHHQYLHTYRDTDRADDHFIEASESSHESYTQTDTSLHAVPVIVKCSTKE